MQYPIGWLSDRMDRRLLIMAVAALAGLAGMAGFWGAGVFTVILAAGFVYGGMANPLYALLLAHTNDFLETEQMPAAGGRLVFITGVGAIFGPLLVGQVMNGVGAAGFFLFLTIAAALLAAYALYRTGVRPAADASETESYAAILPQSGQVFMEAAQDYYAEAVEEATDGDAPQDPADPQTAPAAGG
ncbi:MAG: MFS transporter [Pseudomonadota bacterium]